MTIVDLLRSSPDPTMDRCFRFFPCLADPGRRSSLCLKLTLVTIHVVYLVILFLFDGDLIEKTKKEPWYTALYLLLFAVTLIQYFATSISSPGYALDAMRAVNERNTIYKKTLETSNQSASSRNGSIIVTVEGNQTGRNVLGSNATAWSKLVADLYSGSIIRPWTCTYCNVEQVVSLCRDRIVPLDWCLVYFIPEGSHYTGLVAGWDHDTTLDHFSNFCYLSTSPTVIS